MALKGHSAFIIPTIISITLHIKATIQQAVTAAQAAIGAIRMEAMSTFVNKA